MRVGGLWGGVSSSTVGELSFLIVGFITTIKFSIAGEAEIVISSDLFNRFGG